MFNIKENFPALYQDILDNIPSETAQKLKSKTSFIETNKEEVLEYLHDYSKVSQDVFDNLEVWSYMEEYSEEIDEFLEEYPKLNFDKLCDLIEEEIANDCEVQKRISGVMLNYNYYEMNEEFEDVVINNLPEKQNTSRDENER